MLKTAHEIKTIDIISQKLRNNRDMLSRFYSMGKRKVGRKLLDSKGFDFGFYTTIRSSGQSHLIFYCYDFGYVKINESELEIVKLNV